MITDHDDGHRGNRVPHVLAERPWRARLQQRRGLADRAGDAVKVCVPPCIPRILVRRAHAARGRQDPRLAALGGGLGGALDRPLLPPPVDDVLLSGRPTVEDPSPPPRPPPAPAAGTDADPVAPITSLFQALGPGGRTARAPAPTPARPRGGRRSPRTRAGVGSENSAHQPSGGG